MINNHLISIIIPCYNAENFIVETINSVLGQTYSNLEVIIIDDGSTDNGKSKIEAIGESNIQYIHQLNQGVSIARNNGLKRAKGKYILFLDADDIISANFIMNRFKFLETNTVYGACCSTIEIINKKGEAQKKHYKNVSKVEDLTSFNPKTYTCPSGYLFRGKTLKNNHLIFNQSVSSSADKLFLYNFFKFSTIGFIESSPLFYRVYDNSMSNNLSEKLVEDHITYLNLIIANKVIPEKEIKKVTARINYTIGASYCHLRKRKKALYHLFKSFTYSPKVFIQLMTKKEANEE